MARAGNPCVVQYYATKAKNMNYKDLRHCRQLTFINNVRRRSGGVQMWTTGLRKAFQRIRIALKKK
jgi:hypothetical protein